MTEPAPPQITWTEGHYPVSSFVLDTAVNPRIGDAGWARKQLGSQRADGTYPGYNPDLLGAFVISERPDGTRVLLDGANRRQIMEMAGDMDRLVLCQVVHGMTQQQEAAHAKGINERRSWTPVRKFLAEYASGSPEAVFIIQALRKSGWTVDITGGNGTLRGVIPLRKLIRSAERLSLREAESSGIRKMTEQHNAALLSGRAEGHRALEDAISVVSAAWPLRESPYTADIIYGIGLVFLRDGRQVKMQRLSEQLLKHVGGKLTLITSAKQVRNVNRNYKIADAVATLVIVQYNQGLHSRSGDRLEEVWRPIAV